MPWCPSCKNEYKEGIMICPDCDCNLVLEETDIKAKLSFGDVDEMEELAEFLRSHHIRKVETSYDEEAQVTELSVAEVDCERAKSLSKLFLMEKIKRHSKSSVNIEEEDEENKAIKIPLLYENSAEKAEDNKSSAYTLLLVGIVGIIVIILGIADVLPIHLYGTGKYMTYGIMGALFVLFIVMGLVSIKSYRIFARKAESENSIKDTMKKWCVDSLKPEEIDAVIFVLDGNVTEEEKYFNRAKAMKEKLKQKFLNLDEAFLDHFVDEIYGDIFVEEEKRA